jgi:hypothetical protein
MGRLFRASFLGYKELALTPALSPRRGGIVRRLFETTNDGSRPKDPMSEIKGIFPSCNPVKKLKNRLT